MALIHKADGLFPKGAKLVLLFTTPLLLYKKFSQCNLNCSWIYECYESWFFKKMIKLLTI